MNRTISLIIVLLLLQLPILLFQAQINNDKALQNEDNLQYEFSPPIPLLPVQSGPFIESNDHGGSWLDSFNNETGIDHSLTYNIETFDGEVNLDQRGFVNVFKDDFSTELDPVKWINNTSTGTTLITKPFLKGLKNGQAQPDYSYIQTNVSFDSYRIFEWDWNSYSESGPSGVNGYIHSFVLSRGNTEVIQLTIRPDLKIYIRNSTEVLFLSTNSLSLKTWYHMKLTVNEDLICFEALDPAKNIVMEHTYSSEHFDPGIESPAEIFFATKSTRTGFNFDVRVDNFKVHQRLRHTVGNVTSIPIDRPSGMLWDKMVVNSSVTTNSTIKFSIIDDSTKKSITGFENLDFDGELDVSGLNTLVNGSIRLSAQLKGNGKATPELYYWGVSWNKSNAWRDTFFKGADVNSNNLSVLDGESFLPTDITDWLRIPGNPIIADGSTPSWDDQGVSAPAVLFNGSGYMMWYVGMNNSIWNIGLATSADGITWIKHPGNPVLKVGPANSWEERHVGAPCVIFDGSTYKMWYQGQNKQSSWKVGYATSSDGVTWQKHPSNPVLSTSAQQNDWDGHFASLPNVISENSRFKIWYTGISGHQTVRHYQVGYASSVDGIDWTKYEKNPIVSGSNGWYQGTGNMFVLKKDVEYLGWYNNKITSLESQINFARSSNRINWDNHTANPVLKKSSGSGWDNKSVYAPEVLFNGKQYLMYYAGSDSITSQIGLAKSRFLSPGTITSGEISIPENKLYGRLIITRTEQTGAYSNITLIDSASGQPIPGFINLAGNEIDISSIDSSTYPSLRLTAEFFSTGLETPELFDWSLNWTERRGEGCVDIDPDTLNLKSKGNWITVYIEPKDGRDPANINISTVIIYLPDEPDTTVSAAHHPATVGDHDNDSLPDLMVKFKRSDVQVMVSVGENVTLAVEGYYNDGLLFKCSDTIRVINPPDEPHNNGKGNK